MKNKINITTEITKATYPKILRGSRQPGDTYMDGIGIKYRDLRLTRGVEILPGSRTRPELSQGVQLIP